MHKMVEFNSLKNARQNSWFAWRIIFERLCPDGSIGIWRSDSVGDY
jgi:hypothetical protein